MTTITDRRAGLSTSVALKPPCKVAATSNLTLFGEQTVAGVAVFEGDRVLAPLQTSPVDNGIYVASTSGWSRAKDFDGANDVVDGTLVLVGTTASASQFWLAYGNTDPILPGTSQITFEQVDYQELALRGSLASIANALDGAGLVAFSPALAGSYATDTVGARVDKSGHPSGTNTILGAGAADDHLLTGTAGYRNTIVGVNAGASVGSSTVAGGSNSWYGFGTGNANVEGSGNNAFGALSLNANTSGDHNNAFGYQVLNAHTSGTQNNGFGFRVLYSLTSGNNNHGFGESALTTLTSGSGNHGFGYQALYSKTTGDYSTAVGYQAGFSETTAVGNVSLGYRGLFSTTTAGGNTALGYGAISTANAGINNTAVGFEAGKAINGGTYNVVMGYQSGIRLSSGGSNTLLGQQSGAFVTTGTENFIGGNTAGSAITTGTRNVIIGAGADSSANRSNVITLGYNAQSTGDNQVTLGDTNISQIRAQVTSITSLSDARDKKDIQPLDALLPESFIDEVEPVAYRWAMRDGTDRGNDLNAGVIAQQLKAVQDKYNLQWLKLVDEKNPDRLEATPGNLLIPLLVCAQRQSKVISDVLKRVEVLEAAAAPVETK